MKHTIELRKPIYGSNFGIRDKFLNDAIKDKSLLKVKYKEDIYLVDPKKWIKTGEKREQVFLIPEHPMVLYTNFLFRFPKEQSLVEQWTNE